MQSFLDKLADTLLEKYGAGIGTLAVVFPSRRAGLFFKQVLSRKIKQPIWSPEVMGLEDFIEVLSPYRIEERITLIFELWEVYTKYSPGETFEDFYPWGDMILNDFDEIDKSLAPAGALFRIIREHRELEERFDIPLTDYEEFAKFWEQISSEPLGGNRESFVKKWEILGKVYKDFRHALEKKLAAYEGMAYRKISEDISRLRAGLKWEKVIFAGFNALNRAEEVIIRELLAQKKCEVYWDADSYYVNDPKQEAGKFLRNNITLPGQNELKWIDSELAGSKKNIKIIGAPLQAGQVKSAGSELAKQIAAGSNSASNTVIVLPEESLLVPLLHSLPESTGKFNITMGYPFKNTPLFGLIGLLKTLQAHKRVKNGKVSFYHKDVAGILANPLLRYIEPAGFADMLRDINEKNLIYADSNILPESVRFIFSPVDTAEETIKYLFGIIEKLNDSMQPAGSAAFEREYLYILHTRLNKLYDIISTHIAGIERDTFFKLLNEVLLTTKIPFSGEPLEGLQIMGLLETRALDFENVYILNMNEGILPRGNAKGSFIPYRLRKAFRLPTFEDDDSISAYYFYRLLQRAKNIYMFYNTEPGTLSTGEKSRFIMQLETELVNAGKNVKIENYILSVPPLMYSPKEIVVEKNQAMVDSLTSESHYFSPTALITYITCGLKFYLERIENIREESEIEDFFGGATFGSIFHALMQELYGKYKGKIITASDIDAILKKLNENYDETLANAFVIAGEDRAFADEMEGRNLLYKGIIKKLAEKVLEIDHSYTPFKIAELEDSYETTISVEANGTKYPIRLKGRIDRIDTKDGETKVLDYKTGKVKAKSIEPKDYEKLFADSEYKEYFQTYFYSLLYLAKNPKASITPAIYPLRNISDGLLLASKEPVNSATLSEYKKGVETLLSGLLNLDKPFTQTTDKKRCSYCPYISICYRD